MNEFTGSAASQADFIWKNAEDLWGDFKHTDFGKVEYGPHIPTLLKQAEGGELE